MGCCVLVGVRGTEVEVLKEDISEGGRREGERQEACSSKENDMTL